MRWWLRTHPYFKSKLRADWCSDRKAINWEVVARVRWASKDVYLLLGALLEDAKVGRWVGHGDSTYRGTFYFIMRMHTCFAATTNIRNESLMQMLF